MLGIKIYSFLIFAFSLFGKYHGLPSVFDERIVGGVQVKPHELPYSISLQYKNGGHFCGAVIYDANYILTAAHCVVDRFPEQLQIVAGEHNLEIVEGKEQVRYVQRIYLHPQYNGESFENDIAILKLSTALSLNEVVTSIKLPEPEQITTGVGIVSGWGATEVGSSTTASILRKVKLPIVSNKDCASYYADHFHFDTPIKESMFCAGFKEGGKDSCQGDSGGPFVVGTGENRYLAGIVSWGYMCAIPERPGVYTAVSHFIDFIDKITKS